MTEPIPPIAPDAPVAPPIGSRRWRWILLAIILVPAALVLLLPTILSSSAVRQQVVGKINQTLHGRLEIADWSIGWTGSELRNLRILNSDGAEVLSVVRIRTSASLLDTLRGNLKLGRTEIDEPNFTQLVIGADGVTNLQAIFGRDLAVATRRPLTGDFAISRLRATVVDRRDATTRIIEPSMLMMQIQDAQSPLAYNLILNVRTSEGIDRTSDEGTADVPDALIHPGNGPLPIRAVSLGASEAILRTLAHRLSAQPPTTPGASQPAWSAPSIPR